jgi:hypothetical protein
MHADLGQVGQALQKFAIEQSFSWEPGRPRRYSCWLAARDGESDFIQDPAELEQFDGDREAGLRGLAFLGRAALKEPLKRLKGQADAALRAAALAIGIPEDYLSQCTTRYRVIHYPAGEDSGIGVHFDGNGLSAVLTDAPGLREIGYDGQLRSVDPRSISVMSGSSVHRLTRETPTPLLPVFHDVEMADRHSSKTSMAAFWNFPDRTAVNQLGGTLDHNVGKMKQDDGPDGSLRELWEQVAQAHGVSMESLVSGEFN